MSFETGKIKLNRAAILEGAPVFANEPVAGYNAMVNSQNSGIIAQICQGVTEFLNRSF